MTGKFMLTELSLAKGARKETAIITLFLEVNEVGAGKGSGGEDHEKFPPQFPT
jgi:hypothetical protein